MNADDDEASEPPGAPVGVTAEPETSPEDPFELLNKEPAEVSSLRDSFVVEYFKPKRLTESAENALAAEIWLRHWLYAGECSSVIEQAIVLAQNSKQAGFSKQISIEIERLLIPLRKDDDGCALPCANGIDDEREKRIWGLLLKRVRDFLEADGLMALIPNGTHTDDDGVAVPFRFYPREQGICQDGNEIDLTASDWTDVLEGLGALGPLADSQALRVGAVFPSGTPPGGDSIGLSVALAWARRQARDLPLFSPLDVIATGKIKGEQIFAVDGTGGQAETDTQGGAKGQLANRLGVKLYIAVDASTDFSMGNGKVCAFTSSTQWKDAHGKIVQAVREIILTDSPRHLRLVEVDDPKLINSDKASEAQLWACWRRLGRLQKHSLTTDFDQIEAWRRNATIKLGYKSIVPGFYDFSIIENRHGKGELRGRKLELQRLDDFLSEKEGMLPVTGPAGHGKSALLTRWRHLFPINFKCSIFFHYFDQNDDRLRSRSVFYRRLVEHLLIEVEGRPTDREPTEQDVLEAWHLWGQKENRHPLVLVIDGLDEAEQCPPPFPDNFPQNVWLVVSCRSRQGSTPHSAIDSWRKRAGDACRKQLDVGPLDIPNLCSWLATLVEDWRPTSPAVQNLAAKVFDRTGGMALFIHHLWDDLCEAIAKGEDLDMVLEKTPVGFVEYLQNQWQRLNDDALVDGKCLLALKIVGYLLAAKGPLTNRELVSLLDLEPGMSLTNLPREAQRWVAVRPVAASDAWGAQFSLNHWLIREAIGSQLRPEVYGKTLFEKCMSHWRDGSPYALRHLADHLIEKGLWRELDKLVIGNDADEFQRFQSQTFRDEPALLLVSVQRSLEAEAEENQPNLTTLTELSITQATLVYRLAKPLSSGNASNLTPLEIAEQMTQLPVHWDPAANFMWHLVAAWQLNRQGRSTERNNHLNALGTVQHVRLPISWGLLAGAILTETVGPFNPLLRALADRHVLSDEAVAEMVGRLATKGSAGRRAALQWLQFQANTQLRGKITENLTLSGLYNEAGELALSAPSIKEQANLLIHIADSVNQNVGFTGSLRGWTEELDKRFDESFWKVTFEDLLDVPLLIRQLKESQNRVSIYLLGRFNKYTRQALNNWHSQDFVSPDLKNRILIELNAIIEEYSIWSEDRFANVELRKSVQKLVQNPHLEKYQTHHLNRLLLEDFFGRALGEKKALTAGDGKRIRSVLGRLQVIRARLSLLDGRNDVEGLVEKAVWAVGARDMESGCFDVQCGLALAFAVAADKHQNNSIRTRLNMRSRFHRRNAFLTWLKLRKKPSAHTLEIFQIWLWFTDLTFKLVGLGVLPKKIGNVWESRLRRTLLPKNKTERARIFDLLNAGRDSSFSLDSADESHRLKLRYFEPVEWDHSIVVATEAMVTAQGFTDDDVLEVIGRCVSPTDRARSLAWWVQERVKTNNTANVESALNRAQRKHNLKRADLAAAHSLFTRQLITHEDDATIAHHVMASIQYGTDFLHGEHSVQFVNLLTALSQTAGKQGARYFDQAVQLVIDKCERPKTSDEEKTFLLLQLAETTHLRDGSSASNYWFTKVLELQQAGGNFYEDRSRTITVLCQYARRLNLLQFNTRDKGRALSRALGAARGERSIVHRCELLCEVAEAYSYCQESQIAKDIFAEMQAELPASVPNESYPKGFMWSKQGIKPRLIRGYCLAELVLGLGKVAIQQSSAQKLQARRLSTHYELPWDEWTWEGGGLTSRQRADVRNIYSETQKGNLAAALKLATQIPETRNGSTGLRAAVCREIISIRPWLEWMDSNIFTTNQRKNVTTIYEILCAGNPVDALFHTIRLSGDDSVSSKLRMGVCLELALYLDWSEWALAYASDADLQKHDGALRGLALASAVQGNWGEDTGVWSFVKRINDPSVSANTIRDLAEFSAAIGNVEEVLKRAKNLMASRDKDRVLHRIGSALAERFKQSPNQEEKAAVVQAIYKLIPPCAEFFGATYLTLASLIKIKPDKWRSISDVLNVRGMIAPKY